MAASEGRLIRPLLGRHARADRRLLPRRAACSWREDESNDDERFARARVRNGLLPALRAVHPAAEANVLRTAALLREETELLDGLVAAELDGRASIAIARLRELPAALARMVVVRLAEQAAGDLRAAGRRSRARRSSRSAGRGGRAELHVGGQAGAVDRRTACWRWSGCRRAPGSARADRCRPWRRLDSARVASTARVSSEPGLGEVLVTAEDLQRRVAELGEEISRDYAGRPLLLVGVLKGAVFFLSDLMRYIDIPVEVDFMAVASYGSATDSSGVVRILKDLDAAIEGRDVLIVEDIVDSGLTLQYLLRNLGSRNPAHARGVRAADQARAAQGRSADPLCRLRDPRPLRRRLRPRLRRALPQPALRGGAGALDRTRSQRARRRRPQAAGKPGPAWYARALVATTSDGARTPRNQP